MTLNLYTTLQPWNNRSKHVTLLHSLSPMKLLHPCNYQSKYDTQPHRLILYRNCYTFATSSRNMTHNHISSSLIETTSLLQLPTKIRQLNIERYSLKWRGSSLINMHFNSQQNLTSSYIFFTQLCVWELWCKILFDILYYIDAIPFLGPNTQKESTLRSLVSNGRASYIF